MISDFEECLGPIEDEIREDLVEAYKGKMSLFRTHLDTAHNFPLHNLEEEYRYLPDFVNDFLNQCKSLDRQTLRYVFFELYKNNKGMSSLQKVKKRLLIVSSNEIFNLSNQIEGILSKLFKLIEYDNPKLDEECQIEIEEYLIHSRKLNKYLEEYYRKSASKQIEKQTQENAMNAYIAADKYCVKDLDKCVSKIIDPEKFMKPYI